MWSTRTPDEIYRILAQIALSLDEYRESELPTSTPDSTWYAMKAAGGETAADAAGCLSYGMKITMKSNGEPVLTMGSPRMGPSRRLYRTYPARRLLRVTIDEDSERVIRDEARLQNKTKMQNFLRRPIRHLGRHATTIGRMVVRCADPFKGTYYRPFFYQKGAIYFWAFCHMYDDVDSTFPPYSVGAFLDQLIPRQGPNEKMTLAKYSARISLWLSKTTPIIPVQDIRWVPDLTNHTLAIGARMLRHIALKVLKLGYVPCKPARSHQELLANPNAACLAGTYGGKSCTWALDYDIDPHGIQVFREEQDDDQEEEEDEEEEEEQDEFEDEDEDEDEDRDEESLKEDPDELFLFTFHAFAGLYREEVSEEALIKRRNIVFEDVSEYPKEIMTDGVGAMATGLEHFG